MPLLRNPYYRMCCIGFLADFVVMIAIVATPFFILNQIPGGDLKQCGTIMALQAASYALTCIFAAGFVARARHGLNWAIFGMSVFCVMHALPPLYPKAWFCALVTVIAHGGIGFVWPALHSWVGAEPDPDQRTRHMVGFNLAWSSAFALSPLFAGPVYDLDFRLAFLAVFLLGIVTLVLLLTMPHERDYFGLATVEQLDARADHDRKSEAFLYCAWCATLLANVMVGTTRSLFPDRMQQLVETGTLRLLFEAEPAAFLLNNPATKMAWPAAFMSTATALAFLTLALTNRWRHRFGLLLAVQLVAGASLYILGHTTSLVIMSLCFIPIGANLGLAFFASAYYSLSDPAKKHQRASINEGAVGVGNFIGNLGFAYVVVLCGFTWTFHRAPIFIGAVILIQALLLFWGLRRMRGAIH